MVVVRLWQYVKTRDSSVEHFVVIRFPVKLHVLIIHLDLVAAARHLPRRGVSEGDESNSLLQCHGKPGKRPGRAWAIISMGDGSPKHLE